MKSFVTTILLLCLMILVVSVNFFHLSNVTDELFDRLSSLPENAGAAEEVQSLYDDWTKHVFWVNLSVNYSVADRVTEQAALLLCAARSRDDQAYRQARVLLEDAIEDLRCWR